MPPLDFFFVSLFSPAISKGADAPSPCLRWGNKGEREKLPPNAQRGKFATIKAFFFARERCRIAASATPPSPRPCRCQTKHDHDVRPTASSKVKGSIVLLCLCALEVTDRNAYRRCSKVVADLGGRAGGEVRWTHSHCQGEKKEPGSTNLHACRSRI